MSEKTSNIPLIQIAGILVGLAVCWFVLFFPTFQSLYLRWSNSDEPYTQSYIVMFLIVYLIGFRLNNCQRLIVKPNFIALIVLAIPALMVWSIGYLSYTQILTQLALPLILWFWIYSVFGTQLAKLVAAPLALFYFAVPFWGAIGTLLRKLTVGFVDSLLEITGIPSYVDGYYIHLPSGIVEVAGGCSGQNYFISGLIIASFYAMRYLSNFHSKLFCIVLMGVLAIIANWIRVFALVLIGYYSDMTHSLMHEHSNFGWLIFALILIPYIFFVQKLEVPAKRGAGLVNKDINQSQMIVKNKNSLFFGLSFVVVVFSYSFIHVVYDIAKSETKLPFQLNVNGDRGSQETAGIRFLPGYKGYDNVQVWVDDKAGYREEIVLLAYYTQTQGKELIHESNKITEERKNSLSSSGIIELFDGQSIAFEKAEIDKEPVIIFWVYSVANWYVVSDIQVKLLQVYTKLFSSDIAGLLTFTVYCGASCDYMNLEQLASRFNEKLKNSEWEVKE